VERVDNKAGAGTGPRPGAGDRRWSKKRPDRGIKYLRTLVVQPVLLFSLVVRSFSINGLTARSAKG